jgi:hypothetical protein
MAWVCMHVSRSGGAGEDQWSILYNSVLIWMHEKMNETDGNRLATYLQPPPSSRFCYRSFDYIQALVNPLTSHDH